MIAIIGVFFFGVMIGFLVRIWWTAKFRNYDGTIYVTQDDRLEKTVYSLILDDYPEKLKFEKRVVFKVDKLDTLTKSQSKQ
jgi:hypothetical protein